MTMSRMMLVRKISSSWISSLWSTSCMEGGWRRKVAGNEMEANAEAPLPCPLPDGQDPVLRVHGGPPHFTLPPPSAPSQTSRLVARVDETMRFRAASLPPKFGF